MDKVIENLSTRMAIEKETEPIELTKYGEAGYWDNRYIAEEDKVVEWLEDYQSLKKVLLNLMKRRDGQIL